MVENSLHFLTITGVRDSSSFEMYSLKPIAGASNSNSDTIESSAGFLCKMRNHKPYSQYVLGRTQTCILPAFERKNKTNKQKRLLHRYSLVHTFCSFSREVHLYWSIKVFFLLLSMLCLQAYRKYLKALRTEENVSDGTNNKSAILSTQLLPFLWGNRLVSTHN